MHRIRHLLPIALATCFLAACNGEIGGEDDDVVNASDDVTIVADTATSGDTAGGTDATGTTATDIATTSDTSTTISDATTTSTGDTTTTSTQDTSTTMTDTTSTTTSDTSTSDACSDSCGSENATRCSNNATAVQTCTRGGDGCLAWTTTAMCGGGESCMGGECQADCQDECANTGDTQCANGGVETCGTGGNGCLEWGNASACGANEMCSGGECIDPNARTQAQVCSRWKADFPVSGPMNWTNNGNCDPGSISTQNLADAVRRANLYRYLAGLPDITENTAQRADMQACAVLQAENDGPSGGVNAHNPPNNWDCYTQAGAGMSGASNLSWGVNHVADTVTQWMVDRNTASLGHRLWILNPRMGQTAFGWASGNGQWNYAACMYSFDSSAPNPNVEFVAYPPAGPVPIQAMQFTNFGYWVEEWSFQSSVHSTNSSTPITLTRQSDGDVQNLMPLNTVGGSGRPSGIAFRPRIPEAGETYTVDIGGMISYEVEFFDCQ